MHQNVNLKMVEFLVFISWLFIQNVLKQVANFNVYTAEFLDLTQAIFFLNIDFQVNTLE